MTQAGPMRASSGMFVVSMGRGGEGLPFLLQLLSWEYGSLNVAVIIAV